MNTLQLVSIIFEVLVAVLGLMIALGKKKIWGWGIAFTYAVYVFYDLSNLFNIRASFALLRTLFFFASLSILWAVWRSYRECV